MLTFEYGGVKITLKPANGLNRMWKSELYAIYPNYFGLDEDMQVYVEKALDLLYLVDKVDGDLGFPVPTKGNATTQSVKAFVDGIFNANEQLYVLWLNAVYKNRNNGNSDPDLLPPGELTDDQKKAKSSESKD